MWKSRAVERGFSKQLWKSASRKSRRPDFIKLGGTISSGREVAFAEFFAWYYNTIANGVAERLIAARQITPPDKFYTYAVKAPPQ